MTNVYWVYVDGKIIGEILADDQHHADMICRLMYTNATAEFAYTFNRHLVKR